MINRLLITLVLLTGTSVSWSQTMQSFISAADKALTSGDTLAAFDYYRIATEFDSTRTDLQYNYAHAALGLENFSAAIEGFERVLSSPDQAEYPMATLLLAQSYYRAGQYPKAEDLYEQFLEDNPEDPSLIVLAQKGIDNAAWAMQISTVPTDLSITLISDFEHQQFAPFSTGDTLYFTRPVYPDKKKKSKNGKDVPAYRIYRSIAGGTATPFDELNDRIPDTINVAYLVLNKARTTAYFSLGPYVGDKTTVAFNLYRMDKQEDGSWSDIRPLSINGAGFVSTQPSIFFDEATGKEILYFASDRPGGRGGMDIYFARMEGPEALEAVNISAINTAGNDIRPFLHAPSRTLYFSSEGHRSLGGWDLFRSVIESGRFTKPENLGLPFNSACDDVGYYISDDGQAYFSSARKNAIHRDDQIACRSFYLYGFSNDIPVTVKLVDAITHTPILGATLNVFEGDELIEAVANPASSDYFLELTRDKKYTISIDRAGYVSEKMGITINDFDHPAPIEVRLQSTASFAAQPSIDLYFDHLLVNGGHKFKKKTRAVPDYGVECERFFRQEKAYATAIDSLSSNATQGAVAQEELARFMESKVRKGKQYLDEFAYALINYLEADNQLQIPVEVPPRPGVDPATRQLEAEAMFESLMIYLRNFENGQLISFLEEGQLIFRLLPQQAETARPVHMQWPVFKDQLKYYSPESLGENVVRISLQGIKSISSANAADSK